MIKVAAVPMHGEVKLRTEGLRTRDAHLMEWMARKRPDITISVVSRPEPWPRLTLARMRGKAKLPRSWELLADEPKVVPLSRDRRRWWVQSLRYQGHWPQSCSGALIWNPLGGAKLFQSAPKIRGRIVFDVLDDWLRHSKLASIRKEVREAYARLFGGADVVTANSEDTLALAHRFGREDAVLLLNGCDPERFAGPARYRDRLTIGYGGKLGSRLDMDLIAGAVDAIPEAEFEFAGPFIDGKYRRLLKALPRVRLAGDVHYTDYPALVRSWDLGWVPHRVGDAEVGGDLMKTYEYVAAGLPTITTPVCGAHRLPPNVKVAAEDEFVAVLTGMVRAGGGGHLPRESAQMPKELTWEHKCEVILEALGV